MIFRFLYSGFIYILRSLGELAVAVILYLLSFLMTLLGKQIFNFYLNFPVWILSMRTCLTLFICKHCSTWYNVRLHMRPPVREYWPCLAHVDDDVTCLLSASLNHKTQLILCLLFWNSSLSLALIALTHWLHDDEDGGELLFTVSAQHRCCREVVFFFSAVCSASSQDYAMKLLSDQLQTLKCTAWKSDITSVLDFSGRFRNVKIIKY